MTRLSVIMGVYNIEHLEVFDSAMTSVLKQTMQDFEFIICDDGSTDCTMQILEKYAEKDTRIRLIQNKENKGLAQALNYCLIVSNSAYIARQDADDISVPIRFEKQLTYLESHSEVGFVGANVILFDEQGHWGMRRFPTEPQKKDFLFTQPFVHGTLMFRRSSLDIVRGYRVAKETRRTEDYDLLMRMYAKNIKGANLQETLYWFMENQASMKRRKYCYRIDETIIRYKGFKSLRLLPSGLPYVIKPLVVGLIPMKLLYHIKQRIGRDFKLLNE